MDFYDATNEAVLAELGWRIQKRRLNKNMSQEELAKKSGVSMRTVSLAEGGKPISLLTMISLLRGLSCLQELDSFLPDVGVSPIQIAKLKGRERRRASGARAKGIS